MTNTIAAQLLKTATEATPNKIDVQMTKWSQLEDVDKVLKISGEDWFYELRDVLKKHNALNRFAITLLHKHFEIAEDELMVERLDSKTNKLHMKPIQINEFMRQDAPFAATSFRLTEGEKLGLQTTMWSQLKNSNEITRISDNDVKCLSEIRDVLKKHNALNKFGVKILFDQLKVPEGEILFETTDRQERTQIIRPINMENYLEKEEMSAMTTSWKMVDGEMVSMLNCFCARNKDGHSGGHGY